MILKTICVGALESNCYVLAQDSNRQAIIIDPGSDADKIKRMLDKYKLNPAFIVNTHCHIDHIGCDDEFGVPVYAHRDEVSLLRNQELNLSAFLERAYSVKSEIKAVEDKDKITLDDIELEVIHTPGHSPGGICLLMKKPEDNILFSGDTLFRAGIGRTDFLGADEDTLKKSIKQKLFVLADETVIYPGHGAVSTIGYEKKHNPFL